MNHLTRRVLGGAALALAAGTALADATSQVTLGNVRITLTDLDLSDGVTPWIAMSYESQPYLNGGAGSFSPDGELDTQAYAHLGRHNTSAVSGSASTALSHSAASMTGATNLLGFSGMQASGHALSGANGYGEYGALAANYISTAFTLSANTAVTITLDTSLQVGTTLGFNSVQGRDEHASGHVLLYIDGLDDDGNPLTVDQYRELHAGFQMGEDGGFSGQQAAWAGTLSLTYSNTRAHEALPNVYGEIGIGGASVLAPVPEPGSAALALGGLAVLGGLLRRHRTQGLPAPRTMGEGVSA